MHNASYIHLIPPSLFAALNILFTSKLFCNSSPDLSRLLLFTPSSKSLIVEGKDNDSQKGKKSETNKLSRMIYAPQRRQNSKLFTLSKSREILSPTLPLRHPKRRPGDFKRTFISERKI